MGRRIVNVLNFLTRVRRPRCRPEDLLVLIPSCLQHSQCKQKVAYDIAECRRCGRCKVKDIVEMCESLGVRCAMATGGRLAFQMASEKAVKAVVAVACEDELSQGMRAIFPKAVLGVVNLRPNGPCKDTDVDVGEVRAAIERFLAAR